MANDLLITVTSFFRDEDAWEVLRDEAIRPLVAAHHPDEPFRVWVAGCASGEEAYSIGILLFEEAKAQGKSFPIDIFATDASAKALAVARRGLYPAAAVQHLSADRMERWFEKAGDSYRIKRDLREAIVFAPQDLIQDPPFSRVRLLICRNVLIYLRPELQHKLLRLFHFALNEGGYLFLGSAENIGNSEDLFETVSQKWRLFRRRGATRREILEFPIGKGSFLRRQLHARPASDLPPPERIAETSLMALVERHVPPSVVVDRDLQVLFYNGAMERFLNPQSGEPTNDLASLAREGLGIRLGRLVKKTSESGNPEWERAQIALDGRMTLVSIEVAPLENAERNGLYLISFTEHGEATTADAEHERPQSTHTEDLEHEVKLLRDELRTTIQLSSRAREEHESSKEEIMSMNEELRSTNEEMETSKEELHSLNEELNTVNIELRENVDELKRRTDDINNLLVGTNIATLFLDTKMQIRWFSPAVQDLFNIRASDVGRPIADLVQKFADNEFNADCERVLRSLTPAEKQVRSSDERWFVRQILPYRTRDDRIDGVIVTFADVTAIQAARRYAEEIVETVPVPLLVLDWELRVVSANPAFYETFRVAREKTATRLIYDLGNGQWNIPKLRGLLTEVLAGNDSFRDYEVEHDFEGIGAKAMLLSGTRIDHMQLILLAIEDITGRKQSEAHQTLLMSELSHRVKNVLGVVQGLASQTLARSKSLEEFRSTFEGRLAALSRGHALLLEGEWKETDLGHLIQGATEAFESVRVQSEGSSVKISPAKTLALNLVLHELETNAIKYGALSTDTGHIDLRWSLEDGEGTAEGTKKVRLVWQELDGPPVKRPESSGFGVSLIQQLLRYEMDGSAHLSFEPNGLRCEMVFTAA
ncbi:MAG: PAS domain-containing protein [Alphaproteobacteria bacterium]|nr:PAS domain-containing protein [Alphaproteobacteria bacterium]